MIGGRREKPRTGGIGAGPVQGIFRSNLAALGVCLITHTREYPHPLGLCKVCISEKQVSRKTPAESRILVEKIPIMRAFGSSERWAIGNGKTRGRRVVAPDGML